MRRHSTPLYLICALALVAGPSISAYGQLEPETGPGIPPTDFDRLGQAGWQFLKLPTNARQAAMGGVLSSLGNGDASSAFTNPASIVDVENISVMLSHVRWFADINYTSSAVAKRFEGVGTFGLHMLVLDYGDMPRTENRPILINDLPTGRSEVVTDLGTVTASDLAVGVSYARTVTEHLHFGANVKFVMETLDDATMSAVGLDIGTVFYTGLRSLRVTMVGRNIGRDTQLTKYDERIGYEPADVRWPVNFSFGAAYDLMEGSMGSPHVWTLAGEFVHPNDGPEKVNIGTEYSFRQLLHLRAGYRFNYDEEGVTLGGGVNVALSSVSLAMNYAYWDFGILGATHVVSLGFGM